MARIVLLDAMVLNLCCTATTSAQADEFLDWVERTVAQGTEVVVADCTWYEVRRRLILAYKQAKPWADDCLERFDLFVSKRQTVPVPEQAWVDAVDFWSSARDESKASEGGECLDVDTILASVAWWLEEQGHRVVIATENLKDFRRFRGIESDRWREVKF